MIENGAFVAKHSPDNVDFEQQERENNQATFQAGEITDNNIMINIDGNKITLSITEACALIASISTQIGILNGG